MAVHFTYPPEEPESLAERGVHLLFGRVLNAFASMCRRVAQATFADLGPAGAFQLFDELANIRRLADLDDEPAFERRAKCCSSSTSLAATACRW